jgi:hypothetical protein
MDFNTFMKIKRDYSTKGGDTSTRVSLFPYATNVSRFVEEGIL